MDQLKGKKGGCHVWSIIFFWWFGGLVGLVKLSFRECRGWAGDGKRIEGGKQNDKNKDKN